MIPLVTIPVSLIGSFALMYALGFTVNTLTLLSMVLAIGLVVDDAIVVLENVHRHIEDGMEPNKAAIRGINEIAFAVIAMTLTLVAVYAPMAFSTGRTGKLFIEFALTLAGAVLVSGFVALTLTPMMCAKLLQARGSHGRLYNWLERGFDAMASGYRALLCGRAGGPAARSCSSRSSSPAAAISSSPNLRSELAPVEDRGTITAIGVAPEGATHGLHRRLCAAGRGFFKSIPEVETYLVIVGFPDVTRAHRLRPAQALGGARPQAAGDRSPRSIAGSRRFPASALFATNPPSLGGGGANSKPVEFVLRSAETYEKIKEYVDAVIAEAGRLSGADQPRMRTSFSTSRRSRSRSTASASSDLGVGVDVIGRTMETLLGGRQVTRFNMNGEQYDVVVQVAGEDRNTPQALQSIYLRGRNGAMVQFSSLVSIEETVAPKELIRFNQLRSATITAVPAPGYSLGDALAVLETGVREGAAGDRADRLFRPEPRVQAVGRHDRWSSSCWRSASSIWCWRRSSRASSIRWSSWSRCRSR